MSTNTEYDGATFIRLKRKNHWVPRTVA